MRKRRKSVFPLNQMSFDVTPYFTEHSWIQRRSGLSLMKDQVSITFQFINHTPDSTSIIQDLPSHPVDQTINGKVLCSPTPSSKKTIHDVGLDLFICKVYHKSTLIIPLEVKL